MKNISAILLFLAFTVLSNAQTELSGIITDKQDNQPLIGVNIFILELNKGTITNEKGFYEFKQLPGGHFHVQYSFIGYSTRVEHVYLLNESKELNLELDQLVIQSQEVVVSGGAYRTQHENAIKVETINSLQINQLNCMSFAQALSSVAGVDLISKGPGISTPVIRGLSLSNVLLLNNDIRLENYQFSENHPFMVDEHGIEKIEIIKGPASLLYGSDAIGGVINFIPERSASEGKIQGDFSLGYHSNTNGYLTNLGVKATKNGFFYGIRGGLKSHQDYKGGSNKIVPNSRFNEATAKFNIGMNKTFGKFALFYDYNQMKLGMTIDEALPYINGNSGNNEYWYQDLTNHLIALKNTAFINQFKVNLNLSYQLNTRKLWGESKDPAELEENMQMQSISYELKVYLPTSEKLDVIFGFQGANKQNSNLQSHSHILPSYTNNDFSIFGLYQHDLGEKFHLQAGLRYDLRSMYAPEQEKTSHTHGGDPVAPVNGLMPELQKDYSNLSGSAGATFDISKYVLLRANYASAFRTPNIAELTQDGLHGNRFEQGNRDLKSQRSHEFDFSLHSHTKYVTIDLAAFYNRVNNFIYLTPTADTLNDGDIIYRYVQDNSQLYGFETGLSIKPVKLFQFKFTYAYLVGEKISGGALPFIPQNKINGDIVFNYSKLSLFKDISLRASANYAFEQNHPALFETSTADYLLINASLAFTIPVFKQSLQFSLNINNIFDVQYFDHLSTLKAMGYYNMGRDVGFALKIPFGE